MDPPKQSTEPNAVPGQACLRLGSSIDLVALAETTDFPANLLESARKWLDPFLSTTQLGTTGEGFIASGPIINPERLVKNLQTGLVKIKGIIFKIDVLSLDESALWRSTIPPDDVMSQSSWSSEFDSTDNELPPWSRPPRRRKTPEKKRRHNQLRKAGRARKRSFPGSSDEMPAAGSGKQPHEAHPVVRSRPTNHAPATASDPVVASSSLSTNAVQAVTVPSVPVSTLAVLSAVEISVPVPSTTVPSVPVSSIVPPDNGAEASAPTTTDNGVSTKAPASTDVAKGKKKPRYLALDLSKINVPVPVSPRDTYLFRPVDPSHSLQRCNPRDRAAQLGTLGNVVEVRLIRAGGLAVDFEPSTANHAALLATTDIQGIKLTVSRPLDSHANACGVITGIHPDLTTEDLTADLVSEIPPVSFKRLAKPNQQSWVLKVTFSGPSVPKHVYLYGRRHMVKPYETRPLQCHNCSRFGHPARTCRSAARCATCSGTHATLACPVPTAASCVNCGNSHPATDSTCPSRAFQAKVLETKQLHGITFRAARSAVNRATRSYAAALVGSSPAPRRPGPTPHIILPIQTTATQTEPTFILSSKPAQPLEGSNTTPDLAKILQAVLFALTAANASTEVITAVSAAFVPFLAPSEKPRN